MKTLVEPSHRPSIATKSSSHTQRQQSKQGGSDTALPPAQRRTTPSDSSSRQQTEANFSRAFASNQRGGLPTQLKSGVEQLSGIAMDDVQVHYNSAKPAQMKALAYAQGSNIYVGPGQETHLPHEAWHVVQQKQGRVQATTQLKGELVNNDSTLEREADVMGERAVQAGRSELQPEPGAAKNQMRLGPRVAIVQSRHAPVIQAQWVRCHDHAQRPTLRDDDKYKQEKDGSWHYWYDADKWPHIKESALSAYEKSVAEDPSQQLSAVNIYESLQFPMKGISFADSESYTFYSIHISNGGKILTLTPRSPDAWNAGFQRCQKLAGRTGNGDMGEADVQHIGTHYVDTPKGGNHKHYYFANGVNRRDLGAAVTIMEDEGLIGRPRVHPKGMPYKDEENPDPKGSKELKFAEANWEDMSDSYDVGKVVRAALGLPEREDKVEIEQLIENHKNKQKANNNNNGNKNDKKINN